MKDEKTHYGAMDKSTDLWQCVDILLCEINLALFYNC